MKSLYKTLLPALAIMTLASCQKATLENCIEGKAKKDVISFAPKVTGRILEIYVQEGQVVKAGDTLAKLDVPEVSAKIAQAKGATQAAKMQEQMAKNGATQDQLRQLNAKKKGLQEQYNYAQKSYSRAQNMYRDSLMSPQSFDEMYAKYQGAKAQLDAVNAELHDVTSGTRFEKIGMAEGQSNQAMGALQEANVAYSERYIIATNDMEIETISLHKGELATAGFALFNGYVPSSTYFRFTVPESIVSQYQNGSSLNMKSVYGGQQFEGKIVSVKQLTKYADITTAFPNYNPQEAVYEIKVVPTKPNELKNILVNSAVLITSKK